jgi:hypothetical protein
MSSQKRDNISSGNGGGSSSSSKKARTGENPEFVSDGLDNESIRSIIKVIMKVIQDKKTENPKTAHADIVNSISQDDKFKFFIERYPMLFDMITKDAVFDFESLEYFLSMREEIIKKKITSDEASKQVGQVWFDKFYKPSN